MSCLTAATAIAVLMSIAFAKLGAAERHLDSTVVLLAAVPVVLGYLLVRPSSHALERYHISGVRTLILMSGATPILGALTLVLLSATIARALWAGLVILSWYFVAALFASWLFAAPRREDKRERRWPRMTPRSGSVAGVAMLVGSVLQSQPYSHVAPEALAGYMRDHRGLILISSALVAAGLVAVYTFIGGVWRTLGIRRQQKGERRTAATLVIGMGFVFVWMTIGTLSLIAWQTLTVSGVSDPQKVAVLMRTIDLATNLAILPMLIFMVSTSCWLMWPVELKVNPWLLFVGLIVGVEAVMVRGATLISGANFPAALAWSGFAVWVALVAFSLRPSITASNDSI